MGGTSMWHINGFTPLTTLGIYFDVPRSTAAAAAGTNRHQSDQRCCIQIITRYHRADGQHKLRVTTLCRNWCDMDTNLPAIKNGFDQEAAVVLLTRMALFKLEENDKADVLR